MTDLLTRLEVIDELAKRTDRLNYAEELLAQLIDELPPLAVAEAKDQIAALITRCFLPARQRRLLARLAGAIRGTGTPASDPSADSDAHPPEAARAFRSDVHSALVDLADSSIFQWNLYESFAERLFASLVPRATAGGAMERDLFATLRVEIARHESEITARGFTFNTSQKHLPVGRALEKTNSGLVRFLDIGFEAYRIQLRRTRSPRRVRTLRGVTSAWIAGVLLGRCAAGFGSLSGAQQVVDNWKLWIGYTPLLTSGDLEALVDQIPQGDTRDRLCSVLRPLTRALDELAAEPIPEHMCIVGSTLFDASRDRLEIALVPPIQLAEQEVRFHCYFTSRLVDLLELESAARRDMKLILAPLSDEAARYVNRSDLLSPVVLDTAKSDTGERLRGLFSVALANIAAGSGQDRPIMYNYARRFPLDKPDLGAEFRVRRRSIERLLQQYQSDTGVRLWCSLRRSGKTTSCLDLQSYRGEAVVIVQTCEKTGAAHLDDYFYEAVKKVVADGKAIDGAFVDTTIRKCAEYPIGASKIVFVLDEYESLFTTLDLAAGDRATRYHIVQPILNQLVQFAANNLMILLGLRPDAHFILPDQNQLSPYVRPDRFPLFEYEPANPDCEFRELVRRILTERVPTDEAFLGHVYAETGGHPVMTVNILTTFFDWLIEQRRGISGLQLTGPDFEEFGSKHLTPRAISLNSEYELLRHLARHGLSESCRRDMPWLYAVFQLLRFLGRGSEGKLSCGLAEAERFLDRLGLLERLGLDSTTLLRGAAMANFLELRDRTIRPRIKLLARLTATVPAAVSF